MKQRPTSGRRPILTSLGVAVAAAAVVATIGAGLASGGVGPVVSPGAVAGARPVPHVVDIRDLRFEPDLRVVGPGDTIVWVNHDFVPHTVDGTDSTWSSGNLAQGASWRTVAGAAGEISYSCEYHPTMRGVIRIE